MEHQATKSGAHCDIFSAHEHHLCAPLLIENKKTRGAVQLSWWYGLINVTLWPKEVSYLTLKRSSPSLSTLLMVGQVTDIHIQLMQQEKLPNLADLTEKGMLLQS